MWNENWKSGKYFRGEIIRGIWSPLEGQDYSQTEPYREGLWKITIVTGIDTLNCNPYFLIDYPGGSKETFKGVKRGRVYFEYSGEDRLQYRFRSVIGKIAEDDIWIRFPKVIERIQQEVNELNKQLGMAEQVKRFRLVHDEWSPLSGELSPTLKLKRKFLLEKYSDIIKDIFSVESNNWF